MHASRRNLLAAALAATLAPALALADKPASAPTKGNATAQAATSTPRPSLPTPAVDKAGSALQRNPQYDSANTRDVGKDASHAPAASATASADAAAANSRAGTNPGKGNWWTDADGDSDGRISRSEASANAGLDSRFATIDADADGYVTRDEYQAYYTANASQGAEHAADHASVVVRDVWSRFDADGDGRLTAVEIDADARLKADFGAVDADHDGFVSDAEYRAYYPKN
jgi:hypothetical protein